jgi:hypothetical protein
MRVREAVHRVLCAARRGQGRLGAAQLRPIPYGLFLASLGNCLRCQGCRPFSCGIGVLRITVGYLPPPERCSENTPTALRQFLFNLVLYP